jgi:NAD(P) transhydrogenase subunit alpha
VAVVPEVVPRLTALGAAVLIESGAGSAAHFTDNAYSAAGAEVADADAVHTRGDVLLRVAPPADGEGERMRARTMHAGLLRPFERAAEIKSWADRGVTTVCLDLLPRTLSRAQTMDALTSQASIAGYRAVIRAAEAYQGWFPMLMTAAGTVRPAEVLVLGTGVAGLQAIATARRLGARVSAYDIRPSSRDEVVSLGARFVDLPGILTDGAGAGGYARELTADEQRAQQRALDEVIARSDVVITTAQVPGRRPPQLVSAPALAAMRPGSVIVDAASSDHGGNVAGSEPGRTITIDGVSIIGGNNLPAEMAAAASTAYARNLAALLKLLVVDGKVVIDLTDDVQSAIVVTHGGKVTSPAIADLLPNGSTSS